MTVTERYKIVMEGYDIGSLTETTVSNLHNISDQTSITDTSLASSYYSITITNEYNDYAYLRDDWCHLDDIKLGWNNPIKIGSPISVKTIYKNNMIRNRLHKNKLRINETSN